MRHQSYILATNVSFLLTALMSVSVNIPSWAATPVEVIEVTAQKRIQSIQEVPIAMTVISDEHLSQFQLLQASSVAEQVPNLNVTRSIGGVYNYFIRGVGMDDFNLSSIPAVGLYVDDVAIQNPMLANFSLLNVARVEVLRGPQNTLYGKNTTGGAVNFISRLPEVGQEQHSNFYWYFGSGDLVRFTGSYSFSVDSGTGLTLSLISDQQNGRVSASHIGNGSQFDNSNKFGFKLQLAHDAAPGFSIASAFYGGRQRQITEVKTLLLGDGETGRISLGNFDLGRVDSKLNNPRNDADSFGCHIKLSWHLDGYALSSVTAFEKVKSQRMDDWGSQSLQSAVSQVITYNSTDTQAYSQEFQILSPVGASSSWLAGLLLNWEAGDLLQAAYIDPAGPGRPDDAIDDAGVGPLFDRAGWVETETFTYSAYGQYQHSFNQTTSISAGLRWTVQELTPSVHAAGMLMDSVEAPFPLGSFGWYSLGNDGFDVSRDFAGFAEINNFVAANQGFPASAHIDETYQEWGGKLSLSKKLGQNATAYLSLARGFKMGSVNSNPTTAAFQSLLDNTVQPESLVTYEVGLKSEWLGRQLRVNGALFRNDWQDYQFFLVYNPGDPASLFASLVNLPEAKSYGAELELTAVLGTDLTLSAGFGYLDAEVTDANLDVSDIAPGLQQGLQNSVLAGDRLPNAPRWTANATLQQSTELAMGELELALQYYFKDGHIHALAGNNSALWQYNFSEQPVALFNVSAQFTPSSWPSLSLHLWVRNLTDEQYCTERATIPGAPAETTRLCAQGEPRQLGIGIRMDL